MQKCNIYPHKNTQTMKTQNLCKCEIQSSICNLHGKILRKTMVYIVNQDSYFYWQKSKKLWNFPKFWLHNDLLEENVNVHCQAYHLGCSKIASNYTTFIIHDLTLSILLASSRWTSNLMKYNMTLVAYGSYDFCFFLGTKWNA